MHVARALLPLVLLAGCGGAASSTPSNCTATWDKVEGDCSVLDGCFRSVDYPQPYRNGAFCQAYVKGTGTLTARYEFDLDSSDPVVLSRGNTDSNPLQFAGTAGPNEVPVETDYRISWSSDSHSGSQVGFQLCFCDAAGEAPLVEDTRLMVRAEIGPTMLAVALSVGAVVLAVWMGLMICTAGHGRR